MAGCRLSEGGAPPKVVLPRLPIPSAAAAAAAAITDTATTTVTTIAAIAPRLPPRSRSSVPLPDCVPVGEDADEWEGEGRGGMEQDPLDMRHPERTALSNLADLSII